MTTTTNTYQAVINAHSALTPARVKVQDRSGAWSHGTVISYRQVGDMGAVRFHVALPGDSSVIVSQDRIALR